MCVLLCWCGCPVVCHATGWIAGLVDDSQGAPVINVWVDAYDQVTEIRVDSGFTDTNGNYEIPGLTNGGYYVRTDVGSEGYVDEWHDEVIVAGWSIPSNATPVAVVNGATNIINFTLADAGAITGLVTDGVSPLSNVWVDAYDSGGAYFDSALTEGSGGYYLSGLPAGNFFVRTDAVGMNYADEWFNDEPVIGSSIPAGAAIVAVTATQITEYINFSLSAGGTFSGLVADSTNGPLSNVWVDVYNTDDVWLDSAISEADGYYEAMGLPAGVYHLRTYAGGAPYADEWYDDVPVIGSAIPSNAAALPLSAGQTETNVNFLLADEGVLSGAVTNDSGAPLSGIFVDVYRDGSTWVNGSETDTGGMYSVGGLAVTSYYVRTYSTDTNYVDEWYDDVAAGGSGIPTNAQLVVVSSGSTNTGIDFGLAVGGMISGTVTDTNGLPISEGSVGAYDTNAYWVKSASTSTSGVYTIKGLQAPETFYVQTELDSEGYADEWYDDLPVMGWQIPSGAVAVVVSTGATTGGIDFQLPYGGTITGVVSDTGFVGIAAIDVGVYDVDYNRIGGGRTAYDGAYSAKGLPAGSFYARTEAYATNYANEWYDDVDVVGTEVPTNDAVPVVVFLAQTNGGISFVLEEGAVIEGQVLDTNLLPISSIDVDVYDQQTNWISSGNTDVTGSYQVQQLPASGPFYTRTYVGVANYADEWYDDVPVLGGGIPTNSSGLTVQSGSVTGGIDFVLAEGAAVLGSVFDDAGSPLVDLGVDLFDDGGTWVGADATESDGSYQFSGLPAGSYYVRTDSLGAGFQDEWYDNIPVISSAIPASADQVFVSEAAVSSGIDFALACLIVDYGADTGRFWVTWQAASGTAYQVMLSTNLSGAWTNAPDGTNSFEQSNFTSTWQGLQRYLEPYPVDSNVFYRINIE